MDSKHTPDSTESLLPPPAGLIPPTGPQTRLTRPPPRSGLTMKNSPKKESDPTSKALDARIVPATLIDLTSQGAEARQRAPSSANTRAMLAAPPIRSCVSIITASSRALNIDAHNPPMDDVRSGTRSVRLNEIPKVTIDGVSYRVFLLDIDEPRNNGTLSLDELRIYANNSKNVGGYDAGSKQLGGRSAIFDMDAGSNVTVKLDGNLNTNGKGDAFVLVPNSAFAARNGRDFITLYTKLGASLPARGGREEWSVGRVPRTPTTPPPSSSLGPLSGYVFQSDDITDQVHDGGELGFKGVSMHLIGINDLGQNVDLRYDTDEFSGYYEFTNLRAGTYSIFEETQPTTNGVHGVLDYLNIPGSLGGNVQDYSDGSGSPAALDGFTNIVLGVGQDGRDYNFIKLEDNAQ